MLASSDMRNFETLFARLAFDLAAATHSGEALVALSAAQRAVLMEPLGPLFSRVFSDGLSDAPCVDSAVPAGIEIPRRLVPVVSEFLVEALRNWRAHGHQSRAERQIAGKSEQCRISILVVVTSAGIRIEFHDDGKGVSPELILEKGKSDGLFRSDEFSQLELDASNGNLLPFYTLIFRDGITSRKEADLSAGRGIGLSRLCGMAADFGGRVSAGSSDQLGGFSLALDLPCSLLTLQVSRKSEDNLLRLAGPLDANGAGSVKRCEQRFFYHLPQEAQKWAKDSFGSSAVTWISLEAHGGEQTPFRALGLHLDSAGV